MIMTKDEIVCSYREAKNGLKQIGILADLNCCTKKEVRAYLRECGFDVYEPKGKPAAVEQKIIYPTDKDIKSKAFTEMCSMFEQDCSRDMIEGFSKGISFVLQMIGEQKNG